MPVPPEPEKMDDVLNAIVTLCDVINRQVVAIANIAKALKSDAPATFVLPDPPQHLLDKMEALKKELPKT